MADVTCQHFMQHCSCLFRRNKLHYLDTLLVTIWVLLKAKIHFITHYEMTEGKFRYWCTLCLISAQDVGELTRHPGRFNPGWAPGPVQYSVQQEFAWHRYFICHIFKENLPCRAVGYCTVPCRAVPCCTLCFAVSCRTVL